MIALVDYGAGNLTSVRKAFAAIGATLFVPSQPLDIRTADRIVVPGVGHFGATAALAGAWTDEIRAAVARGVPLLGICLGMQWLYEGSDEAPAVPGLGVLLGRCSRLPPASDIKIPHVGWNCADVTRASAIVARLPPHPQMYFTHSYVAPVTSSTVATTEHGARFASIVQQGAVAGVQFHPEKSSDAGLQVLRNFLELAA